MSVGFRPLIDRQQIQLKRSIHVESQPDRPSTTWWDACMEGLTDRFCFTAIPRNGGASRASAVFWDIEPLAHGWGVHRGLTRLDIPTAADREAINGISIG